MPSQKYSSFFPELSFLKLFFLHIWDTPKNIVPFSGTIILEAVFLHVWDTPKNIVPFFPEL